jgi:hypothetical protein
MSPVKHEINLGFLNFKQDLSVAITVTLQKHFLTTRDNWISNYLEVRDYVFFKAIVGTASVGDLRPNVIDMLSIFFANDEKEIFIERKRVTLIDILSLSGGFANILIFLTKFLAKFYAT